MKFPTIGRETRKKTPRSAPRWMVTFADLMALLFALFVLLLSFSEIDDDKFENQADSMRAVFRVTDAVMPGQARFVSVLPQVAPPPGPMLAEEWESGFARSVRRHMAQEVERRQIAIVEKEGRVVLRFPDKTAFASGEDRLKPAVLPILDKVGDVLAAARGQVIVSGHTDDIPIATAEHRSNWDLSSARAVSVVHHLLGGGQVAPSRLVAQGFADSRPLAPNDSPENRSLNRRVEISIKAPDTEDSDGRHHGRR